MILEDALLVSFNKLVLLVSMVLMPAYGCLMLPGNGMPLSAVRLLVDKHLWC